VRIEKKLINLGGTKAVILPKDWYDDIKRRYGKELTMVYLDVDGDEITITPSWEETEQ